MPTRGATADTAAARPAVVLTMSRLDTPCSSAPLIRTAVHALGGLKDEKTNARGLIIGDVTPLVGRGRGFLGEIEGSSQQIDSDTHLRAVLALVVGMTKAVAVVARLSTVKTPSLTMISL